MTTGINVIEGKYGGFANPFNPAINTGKRFKDGIFHIETVEHFIDRDRTTEGDNGYNYFRHGRITYTVTCKNGITYRDRYEWNQSAQYDINTDYADDAVDHFCYSFTSTSGGCSDGWESWASVDPSYYNPQTRVIAPPAGSSPLKLPIGRIVNQWVGRKVGLPQYYGGPNTLSNPVILINGLGFDFRAMGAVPKDAKGSEGWKKGYVSEYIQGSLPDVMSRAYGLAKGENINHNGIYFLNLDIESGKALSDRQYGFDLLDRFGELLVDHAAGLPITSDLKVDIVCHSTSCIALREAIATISEYSSKVPLVPNPVDHIRKIITVNAPHEGTGLGKSDAELAAFPKYGGLPQLIKEIEKPNTEREIIWGTVELDWSTILSDRCDGVWYETAGCWLGGQILDFGTDVAELSMCAFSGGDVCPDLEVLDVSVSGPFFGPYKASASLFPIKRIPGQPSARETILNSRPYAIDVQNAWLKNRKATDYPKRSNGEYIDVLPFYSEGSDAIEVGLARDISGGLLGNLCGDSRTSDCRALESYVNKAAGKAMDDALMGNLGGDISVGDDAVNLHVNQDYLSMIVALRDGWLKNSDMLIEKESQVWGLTKPIKDKVTDQEIPQLHVATGYKLHEAEVPVGHPNRPVLHGPLYGFASNDAPPAYLEALGTGASLMGRDLFCGLEPGCSELLGRNRPILYAGVAVKRLMPVLLLPNGTIDTREIYTQLIQLENDFDLYPQILSGDFAGVALQDGQGNNKAIVGYDPNVGTWIWIDGPDGGTTQILLTPDRRAQFTLTRDGNEITLTLSSVNGGKRTVPLGTISGEVVNFVVMGDGLATNPVLLIGEATPHNPEMQLAPVEWGSVRPLVQERGDKEANQCRPWIWMTNRTESVQKNLDVVYYFTADPSRNPVVEMDYPRDLAFRIEHIGGMLWALHVSIPELPVKQAYPQSGMQIRIHYSDWTPWVKSDDPSIGSVVPSFLETVVVYDALGRLIWGHTPIASAYEPSSGSNAASITWADAGVAEASMIRPVISLKNVGVTAIASGYRIVLRVAGLPIDAIVPVLDGYYHPGSNGVLTREADGVVRVEWTMQPNALEPGRESGIGEWAIHGAVYQDLNKGGLRFQVQAFDASGVLLAQAGTLAGSDLPTGTLPPQQAGPASLSASWKDAASIGELNTIRPDIQIQNLSNETILPGYKVAVHVSGISAETDLPILEGDWHPDNEGSVERESDGRVRLEWTFTSPLPALGTISLGQWRVHRADWQAFEKMALTYDIQVLSATGVELLGDGAISR